MRGRIFPLWLVVLVLATTICAVQAPAQVSEERQEALRTMAKALEPTVEKLRGLEFKREVPKGIKTPAELREFMLEELDREVSPEEMQASQGVMEKYGLIPKGLDLKKLMIDLYTEQVAGFYNPRTKRLYLIDKSGDGKKNPMSEMQDQMLKRIGLSEEKIYMAHELVHALEDQHFHLMSMKMDELDDEDRGLGSRSLIEGVATVVMFDLMFGKMGVDPRSVPVEQLFGAAGGQGGAFGAAPEIIQEQLIAPYKKGLVLVREILQQGGWEAVNKAYRDPPASSEQVLHPEKYTGERDQPTFISFPDLGKTLGEGWKEIETNVFGEMTISIWLKKYVGEAPAARAAAGWDGDRYRAYNRGDEIATTHYFTWDSEQDAQEFVEAYTRSVSARYEGARGLVKGDRHVTWDHSSGRIHVERREADVVILESIPNESFENVLNALWKSQKRVHGGGLPDLERYPWPDAKPLAKPKTGGLGIAYTLPEGWVESKTDHVSVPVILRPGRGPVEIRVGLLETDSRAPSLARKILARAPKRLTDFERGSIRRGEVGGSPATVLNYSGRPEGWDALHRYRQVLFRQSGKLFVLTFVAPAKAFERHLEAFEHFVASIGQ